MGTDISLVEHVTNCAEELQALGDRPAALFVLAIAERRFGFYAAFCEEYDVPHLDAMRALLESLWAALGNAQPLPQVVDRLMKYGPDLQDQEGMLASHTHSLCILLERIVRIADGEPCEETLRTAFELFVVLLPESLTDFGAGDPVDDFDSELSELDLVRHEVTAQLGDLQALQTSSTADAAQTLRLRAQAQRLPVAPFI